MLIEETTSLDMGWGGGGLSCLTEDDLDVGIKVVVVGNGAVGKSSLIQRYCCGIFRPGYSRTIGADFLERRTTLLGRRVQLMVWDTAGQEEFATITRAYYRGAAACIVAFSTSDTASLAAVRSWHEKVALECGTIPTVLVQTKVDLLGEPCTVNPSDVERVSSELGLRVFHTSALDDHNIEPVFRTLAERHLDLISRDAPVLAPLTTDMFGAADKLRRGDTIVLRAKKKGKFRYHLTRPACWLV